MVLTLTQGGTDQNKGKYANALMLEEEASGPPPTSGTVTVRVNQEF